MPEGALKLGRTVFVRGVVIKGHFPAASLPSQILPGNAQSP